MTSNPNAAYWSQVCFAAENWRIAENLAEGGYDEIAGVYRGRLSSTCNRLRRSSGAVRAVRRWRWSSTMARARRPPMAPAEIAAGASTVVGGPELHEGP